MCGGRGTRLGGGTEKPLTPVAGRPMVDRVVDALAESRIETTHAVVSPHAPRTRTHLNRRREASDSPPLSVIEAPGDGYVSDLQYAVKTSGAIDPPVLTVAADLPLVNGAAVDAVLDAARVASGGKAGEDDGGEVDGGEVDGGETEARGVGSLTVCVPAERKRELGVSADTATEIEGREVVAAGINVVGGADDDEDDGTVRLTDDVRLAVNVNYPSDVRTAEQLIVDGLDAGGDHAEPNAADTDHSNTNR